MAHTRIHAHKRAGYKMSDITIYLKILVTFKFFRLKTRMPILIYYQQEVNSTYNKLHIYHKSNLSQQLMRTYIIEKKSTWHPQKR